MKKKKILFVIGMFAGGGAEKVLLNMVNQMNLDKYDITIYAVFDTGLVPQVKEGIELKYSFRVKKGTNDSIKGSSIKAKIANFLFTYFWKYFPMQLLYQYSIREKYDYEIAYAEGIPHKIVAASTNRKSKKYAWVHIDMTEAERQLSFYRSQRAEMAVYKKFEKFYFVSEYARKQFVKKYGFEDTCETVYNVNQNEEIIKKSLEHVGEKKKYSPLLVTVGRLSYQKGYDRLLRILNQIKREGKSFECWILGDGSDRAELEQYISENGLEDNVKLLGFHSNPYKYIACADWFIAPSRFEGYSTVVSEAYILHKPVMVTDCCGMDELTDDGKYGILVDNDESGIYKGLCKIIDCGEEYDRYVELAIKRSSIFDVETRMRQIERIFEQ